MNRIQQARQDKERLHEVVQDWNKFSLAYPILARYGFMERTTNGYRAIDPEIIIRRSRELISKIENEYSDKIKQ